MYTVRTNNPVGAKENALSLNITFIFNRKGYFDKSIWPVPFKNTL